MNSRLKIIMCILIVAGVFLFYYPNIANFVNNNKNDVVIMDYSEKMENTDISRILEEAKRFNQSRKNRRYDDQLNFTNDGMMGYISIPVIELELPIYHGTKSITLSKGIGHLESSSLPVGGNGTHCVLTGHSGLSNQKMFNSLEKLKVKEKFYLHIGTKILVYQIDSIKKVRPDDVSTLIPVADKDLCTLITCTPYGINTHRLLVMGKRVFENADVSKSRIERHDNTIIKAIITLTVILAVFIIFWRKTET